MLRQAEQVEWRVLLLVVVVAIVLGVVAVFVVSEREERLPTARERVEALVADHPTLPVALPVEVPEGYEMRGHVGFTSRGGSVTRAEFGFFPVGGPRAGRPVVNICVARTRAVVDRACMADHHDPVAIRDVAGLHVAMVPMGPPPDTAAHALWGHVEFTTEWRDLAWLQPSAG